MTTTDTTTTTTDTLVNPAEVVAPRPIAECSGQQQADAIIDALTTTYREIAAAALSFTKGNAKRAAGLLDASLTQDVVTIARIIPILRSAAPTALFRDGNNRGVRVGDLFASKLGLASVYRADNKASLKDAREHLVELAK